MPMMMVVRVLQALEVQQDGIRSHLHLPFQILQHILPFLSGIR